MYHYFFDSYEVDLIVESDVLNEKTKILVILKTFNLKAYVCPVLLIYNLSVQISPRDLIARRL
jgi:hypothetical protein